MEVKYLSPSAISKWLESQEGYYLYYLSPTPPPRDIQTQPMAIGSAFDAYCKSYLHDKLFGRNHTDSNRFEFQAIFEAQVEPQHREWAIIHGAYAFEMYRQSGALNDLLGDLQTARTDPRFEFEVLGQVQGKRAGVDREINGVTLLGKPDAAYVNKAGVHVILDWKVNGYCAKSATSPMKGFVRIRGMDGRSTGCHRECSPFEVGGMTINIGMFLEHAKEDWARQLSIYAWLCGEPVGGGFVVAIDQLVCKPVQGAFPSIRVAEHRLRTSPDFQWESFRQACWIWEVVHSNHIFRELTLKESKARCSLLDQQAESMYGADADPHWLEMTRKY